jgi:hypothetical protein
MVQSINSKKKVTFLLLALVVGTSIYTQEKEYDWAIVGAGPSGIVVVGLLLDLGISPHRIAWIDPKFDVGRLGEHYTTVPGNAKTKLYIDFINACKTFLNSKSPAIDQLNSYDLYKEYPLSIIVDPLRDITAYMRTLVEDHVGMLSSLEFNDTQKRWEVGVGKTVLYAQNVVLAHGSKPRSLNYPCSHEIPLDSALRQVDLAQQVKPEDSIAVIGSAHSAILILKFLSELPVTRIINFYNKPLEYAVDMGTWTLHGSSGLKGITAEFARNILEKNPPANLVRVFNSPQARKAWLPICNKIVYAVGYERNPLPPINGSQELSYDDKTGVIGPRLFGIGIAFPDKYVDPLGNVEHRVGLSSFMNYAQKVVPEWMVNKSINTRLQIFEQLFEIELF